jgi:hypothetical protein
MIVTYDIDGVLAAQPPKSNKVWGKMSGEERRERQQFLEEWYRTAAPLLNPKEKKFYAVSARKNEQNIYNITKEWLDNRFKGRVLGFYLLDTSRTIENVVNFKTGKVLELKAERHYEDNRFVLKGMRVMLPKEIDLYFWKDGMKEPELFLNRESTSGQFIKPASVENWLN